MLLRHQVLSSAFNELEVLSCQCPQHAASVANDSRLAWRAISQSQLSKRVAHCSIGVYRCTARCVHEDTVLARGNDKEASILRIALADDNIAWAARHLDESGNDRIELLRSKAAEGLVHRERTACFGEGRCP